MPSRTLSRVVGTTSTQVLSSDNPGFLRQVTIAHSLGPGRVWIDFRSGVREGLSYLLPADQIPIVLILEHTEELHAVGTDSADAVSVIVRTAPTG
jgi:hypothetical protein